MVSFVGESEIGKLMHDFNCTEADDGKLMHDFNCTEADDMNFDLMAERTRYLKENPEGVNEMCKVGKMLLR